MGACFVAGGLEHDGFRVKQYDLNMALNRLRPRDYQLSKNDLKILTDPYELLKALKSDVHLTPHLFEIRENLVNEISSEPYTHIGLSIDRIGYNTAQNLVSVHFALLLAKSLKNRFKCPVSIGGKHAFRQIGKPRLNTLLQVLGTHNPVDLFFLLEGHTTFPEVLKVLSSGASLKSDAVQGLLHKKSFFSKMKTIVPKYNLENRRDQFVTIKSLFPDFILKKYPEIANTAPQFLAPYKFSLGCPFTCAFCDDGLKSEYSDLGVENIVNILSQLKTQGITKFRFYNNNINVNQKFVDSFHKHITEAHLNISFSDSANLRIINEDILRKLSESGAIKLWYGAETVSGKLQELIHKKVRLERIEQYLALANKYNIWNCLNFIYNFPHESEEDFSALLKFMSRRDLVDCFYRNEFMLQADTEYAEYPERFNIQLKNITDNGLVAAYDEIGGLDWETRLEVGKNKLAKIDHVLPDAENMLLADDHIYFVLHEVFKDKNTIRRVYMDMLGGLRRTVDFDHYAFDRSWRIPPNISLDLETALNAVSDVDTVEHSFVTTY